jgi:uncharacterized protein DUF3124
MAIVDIKTDMKGASVTMPKTMNRCRLIGWTIAAVLTVSYGLSLPVPFAADGNRPLTAVALAGEAGGSAMPQGELIYVPVYSSIFYEDGNQKLKLDTTLAIHNINYDRKITVTRADYYNSEGKLVKKYLEKPVVLMPLQATSMVLAGTKAPGGMAANFLVEWQADQEVNSPVVEALMVNASSNLGVSFTSFGKVLKRLPPPAK